MANMDSNSIFFLRALADHINLRETALCDNIDWDIIFRDGLRHGLEGMIYNQCNDMIPEEFRSRFAAVSLLRGIDYHKKQDAVDELEVKFTEKGIDFIVLKGVEVATLYPLPEERSMSDIDMVVHPEDKVEAGRVLNDLGYISTSVGLYEWKFNRGKVHIELHDHLQYGNVTEEKSFLYTEDAWNHAARRGNSCRRSLDWNFHLVFLILHLYKHFVTGKVGLRFFADLAVVFRNGNVDRDLLKSDLEAAGISGFASVCFELCRRWFDVDTPLCADIDEAFYEKTTETMINTGTFGLSDSNDKYVLTMIKNQGASGAFFSRYFSKLKYMKDDPRFKYLNHCPVLLPYAWISRLVYGIKSGKMSNESKRLKRLFSADEKMKDYEKMLKDWGV